MTEQPNSIKAIDTVRHTDELWEIGQAASYLKCSRRSIRRYIAGRGFPHKRVAGRLLFRRSEIDAWLETNGSSEAA